MPFDQSTITAVSAPVYHAGQVLLSWESSSPPGTWFQVYVGRKLAWKGRERHAALPAPDHDRVRVHIGAVEASERSTDFGSTLPASSSNRVTLTWELIDPSATVFRIYRSSEAGEPVDYDAVIATVPVGVPGRTFLGFGMGGFGEGGFGGSPASYKWTSPELTSGAWTFGVVPVDEVGNEGDAVEVSATIAAPPNPPARDSRNRRLTYSLNAGTKVATLNWLASP